MDNSPVPGRKPSVCLSVRNNMDIQLRNQFNQPFRQRLWVEQRPTGRSTTSQHNFCYSGQPRKLCNLVGDIIAVNRFNRRTQLLRQAKICLQPLLVCLGCPLKVLRFNKQRSKAASKRPCHPGRSADDLLIGLKRRKAHQDLFLSAVFCRTLPALGELCGAVCTPAKSNLPKRAQLRQGTTGQKRSLILFSQTPLKRFWFNIYKFHLCGLVEHIVRNPFGNHASHYGGNRVLNALNMLDIQCSVDIYPRL